MKTILLALNGLCLAKEILHDENLPYLLLKEPASSYEEASMLCERYGASLARVKLTTVENFTFKNKLLAEDTTPYGYVGLESSAYGHIVDLRSNTLADEGIKSFYPVCECKYKADFRSRTEESNGVVTKTIVKKETVRTTVLVYETESRTQTCYETNYVFERLVPMTQREIVLEDLSEVVEEDARG